MPTYVFGKYSEDQERDSQGQWTSGGGEAGEQAERQDFGKDQEAAQRWAADNLTNPKLTTAQKEQLHWYKEQGYRLTNPYLRGDIPSWADKEYTEGREKEIVTIDKVMDRSSLPEDMVLYRGMSFAEGVDQLEVGTTFTDKSYVSTSLSSVDARSFAMRGTSGERALVRIEVDAGQPGIYMEDKQINWSGNLQEEEVLLPRGQTYEVTEVSVPARGLPTVTIRVVSGG